MVKKSKNSYREQYPCINCSQDCEGVSSILCFTCGRWAHSKCIGEGITEELTRRWSARGLKFYCHGCCFDGDEFDMKCSLLRLRTNPKKEIAESEKLLLETYAIKIPPTAGPSGSLPEDNVSVSILKRFHPVTLEEFRPIIYLLKTLFSLFCLASRSMSKKNVNSILNERIWSKCT